MTLLTAMLKEQLPALYATENQGDEAKAIVKFFTPDSNWTWYVTEFDGKDLFFGLVIGHYAELGYFRLSELEAIRGPYGLPVERDLSFKPATIEKLKEHYIKRNYAL